MHGVPGQGFLPIPRVRPRRPAKGRWAGAARPGRGAAAAPAGPDLGDGENQPRIQIPPTLYNAADPKNATRFGPIIAAGGAKYRTAGLFPRPPR